MKKSLIVIASALIAVPAIAAAYDRFLSPTGGVFCPDYSGGNEIISGEKVCHAYGELGATSLKHMGWEHMYLYKAGTPVFRKCFWVNGRTHKAQFHHIGDSAQQSKRRIEGNLVYSCHRNVEVRFTSR